MNTYLSDRRKAKREDAQRWDADTRALCAVFLKTLTTRFREILDQRNEAACWTSPVGEDTVAQLWSEMQLSASPDVDTAAHSYVTGLYAFIIGYDPGRPETRHWLDGYYEARNKYVNAVRKDYKLRPLEDQKDQERILVEVLSAATKS